jgi:hypothetical protein
MIFGPSHALGSDAPAPPAPANIFSTTAADADDYARVIGAGENPSPVSTFTAPPMAPPAKDKKHTTLIVVLVLVGVVLMSFLVWAIFARNGK